MRVDNLSHRPAYQPHVQLLHRHTDNHLGHRPFFQLEDEVEKEETEVQQVGVDFQNIVITFTLQYLFLLGQGIRFWKVQQG